MEVADVILEQLDLVIEESIIGKLGVTDILYFPMILVKGAGVSIVVNYTPTLTNNN